MKQEMKNKLSVQKTLTAISLATVTSLISACGGGGGGGGSSGSSSVLYYPYETVYGAVCSSSSPTPGCTFNRDGSRVAVSQDADYNRYGGGSNDLWYVQFDSFGNAQVYDDFGIYQYTTSTSSFANWVSGSTIGVGTTGLFWENVAGGQYWLGRNGVLYNANSFDSNYGRAINNDGADDASDNNFAAISTESNKALIKSGADKLMKDYGFQADKATAVASALNSWAVSASERGFTTDKDMDKTFKAVFGVDFSSAISATQELLKGDKSKIQDLTNRSAAALGLKPHHAQKFMKGMYQKALSSYGYDDVSW
jgi:uncharacterized protein YfiM (DUF2279 family)